MNAPQRIVVVVFLLLLPLSAKCQCTGRSNEQIYSGGDGNPLTWSSLRNVLGQTVSYERTVENHSNEDVTDIYWPVAGYARDLLPAKTPICDQTTIPGVTDTKNGPLNCGPGSSPVYQTASYCPKDGWPTGQVAILPPTKEPLSSGSLSSELQVAVRSSRGIAICTLRLHSAFTSGNVEGTTKYQYDLENDGPAELRIFWDVPRIEQFEKQFSMSLKEPLLLPPKKLIPIAIEATRSPAATVSTVFIFDSDHNLVGRSIIGVWGVADGKTTTDLLKEWKPSRKPFKK
jgi:hypothetical protein